MKSIRYFIVPLIVIVAVIVGVIVGLQIKDDSWFGTYKPNLFQVGDTELPSDEFTELLNNNPIDQYFEQKINSANAPMEESDVVVEWLEAYEREIEAAYVKLDGILDAHIYDDNADEIKTAKESIRAMKKSYEAYSKDFAHFTFDYRMAILGYGTGIHADSAFSDLRKARQTLFELAEIICSYSGEFNFQFEYK